MHHILGYFEKVAKHCVILNAPSKTFNISDEALHLEFCEEQDRSGITNGNPFGIEALMAAYEEGEEWLEDLKVYLSANIEYVNEFIKANRLPIKTVKTEATFLMWLDCSKMGLEHEKLVEFFVYKAKLGLNDGKSFGQTGEGFMRLNVGTSKEVLEMAMHRLLIAYKGKN
jgi:cystathionine beta-lyase